MPGIADARFASVLADRDLYAELGVSPDARPADLQSAYRRAALTAHPDKGGSAAAFQQLTMAFEVLSCPCTRDSYDHQREQKRCHAGLSAKKACSAPRVSVSKRAGPKLEARQKRQRENIDSMARTHTLLRTAKVAKDTSRRRAAVTRLAGILKSVRQVSSARLKQMLDDMKPGLKEALLTYMKTPQVAVDESGRTSSFIPADGPFYWGSSIRTTKDAKTPRYQPQLRMRYLRIETRAQRDVEVAFHHQACLVHACSAVTAAGIDIWDDASRFCQIFEAGLREAGLPLESLGLSAHIFMRADDMFCRPAVITSPVMTLGRALAVHAQLSRAHRESWESLRAAWVPLMRSTRHARRRALSEPEAFAIADRARLALLERRFARASRAAERAVGSSQSRRRGMAGECKHEARGDKRPSGAALVVRNVGHCPGERKEYVREVAPSFGGA